MATNPMLQAVLLFEQHQTTTPYKPIELAPLARASVAAPPIAGTEPPQPFDPLYQPGPPKEPHHG